MRYILIKSGAINFAPFKIDLKIEFKFLLRLLASFEAQSVFWGFLSPSTLALSLIDLELIDQNSDTQWLLVIHFSLT